MASESNVLRTVVTFDADFPDDGVSDTAGNPRIPRGKNVADVIVEYLRRRRLAVTDPAQHSSYGWQFNVSAGKESYAFLLQHPGPWLLLSRRAESLSGRSRRDAITQAQRKILEEVSRILSRDARFTRQSWFTKEDYGGGPGQAPHEKP